MSDRHWGTFNQKTMSCKVLLVAASMLGLLIAGCGNGTSGGNASTGSLDLPKVKQLVNTLLTTKGTFESPPTTAPRPKAGTNVWLISCGQAYTACSVPINAAKHAADVMGWKPTVFDDKGDPALAGAGIRNAVAQGAKAIFIYYIDCRYIKQPLEEAQKAGIVVAGAEAFDCNFGNPQSKKLYDYITTYSGGLTGPFAQPADVPTFLTAWTKAQADYAIAKQNGKAKTLIFGDDTGIASKNNARAFVDEFKKCGGCAAYNIEFPYSELSTGLQPRAAQELLKHPDVNTVASTYDSVTLAGVAAAAKASGRHPLVIVGEGGPAGLDLVRSGQGDAGAGLPLGWEAYAAMDALNRILQGQKPAPSGLGVQLYDRQHNVPPHGGYQPPVDYVKVYERAWTGKG